MLQTNLHYQN